MVSSAIKKYTVPCILLFFLAIRIPVNSFRLSFQVLALYACVSILAAYLFNKKYHYPALLLLLGMFASFYPILSLTSVQAMNRLVIGVIFYFCIVELRPDKQALYNCFCVLCLIHLLFIFMQALGLEPYHLYGLETTSNTNIGLTGNINEASAMIALLTPCFFRKKWWMLLPLLAIGLYLAKSFGGILSFSVIICLYFILDERKFTGFMVAASLLFSAFFFADKPEIGPRLSIWIAAIKLYFVTEPINISGIVVEKTFLTGFGLGHWATVSKTCFSNITTDWFDRAHNTFVQSFFELGIAFLFILGGYAKDIIKKIGKNQIFIFALISIVISCSVNSAFRINALNGVIIITWLALIETEWRRLEQL